MDSGKVMFDAGMVSRYGLMEPSTKDIGKVEKLMALVYY